MSTIKHVDGQISIYEIDGADRYPRYISALFLTIAPDARSTGMGDVGAASSPDLYSQHWNSAKYAFAERKGGGSLSYTPWLRNLIPGINMGYLSGYYRINIRNSLSGSIRYFTWGKVQPSQIGIWDPHDRYEFAVDVGYSKVFADHFSGGIVIRYIHSDLLGPIFTIDGHDNSPGKSIAGDIGLYYQNEFLLGEKGSKWALGLNFSNIGTPISYVEDGEHVPIPTNLRIGGRFSIDLNEHNTISLHVDANKLMVPTPPVMEEDTATGELVVVRGKESPGSVVAGMFQSFYDAPGFMQSDRTYSVLQEELAEVSYSIGVEYWLHNTVAFRSGYHHEHQAKGNREFFTIGIGGKYRFLAADISYLIPVNGQNSPLANTFRFSLAAELGLPKVGQG